jgi:PAS domain S-box-containing protein
MSTGIRESAECVPSGGRSFRESARIFRTVFETMASAIFICRGKLLSYVNGAAEVITSYTREELISMDFCDLVHPDSRDLITNSTSRCEIKILTKDREERWLDVTATAVDLDGAPGRLVSAFDFTEHKRVEERAQLLAVTDPLTGLGNYRGLLQVLDAELRRFDRTGRPFAGSCWIWMSRRKSMIVTATWSAAGHYAAWALYSACIAEPSIQPLDTAAMSLPLSCRRQLPRLQDS